MEDKQITRRDLVKKVSAGITGATVLSTIPNFAQAQEIYEDPNMTNEYAKMDTGVVLSRILSSQVGSKTRHDLEDEYCYRVRTKEDIDRGFCTVSSPDLRSQLLLKRWGLRENGKLSALKKEKREWAERRRIYPETLAICDDTYKHAKDVISKLAWLPGFEKIKFNIREVGLDGVMINPGGMTELVCTETGSLVEALVASGDVADLRFGFVNTGVDPAIYQINDKHRYFKDEKKNLALLIQKLSNDTGLKYYPENVQGSGRGDIEKNLSGGAIGLQFMPGNALMIYNALEKIGEKFNPFDPESSIVGAWVFLAMNGYKRGDFESQRKAIQGWNRDTDQIKAVFNVANDYYDNVMKIKSNSLES